MVFKGKVEEDIRQSYFGGNVGVFVFEIFKKNCSIPWTNWN